MSVVELVYMIVCSFNVPLKGVADSEDMLPKVEDHANRPEEDDHLWCPNSTTE